MKRAVGPLLVVAAAITLAAAGLALARPIDDSIAPSSGLHGTVYRGPITPVCRISEPCEAPAPGVTLLFTRGGKTVGKTRSRPDGTYRILIAAAIYTVVSDLRGPGPGRSTFPTRVKVRRGHVDKLDFRIDTGIR